MRKILVLVFIAYFQFSFVGSENNEKQLINLKVISLFNIIQKSNETTFTLNDIAKEDYLDIYLADNTNIKTNRNEVLKNKAFIESFEQTQKNRFESFNKIKKTGFNINWKEAKIEAINIEADISERFNKSYRSTIIFSSNSRFYGINFDGIVDLNNNIQIQNFRPPYEFFKEFNFEILLQKKLELKERCFKFVKKNDKSMNEIESKYGNVENGCSCIFFYLLNRQDALKVIDERFRE